MRIETRTNHLPLTSLLRGEVQRRARLALSRYGETLRRVRVTIGAGRDRGDVRCALRIYEAGEPPLVVEACDGEVLEAIGAAFDRARRAVARRRRYAARSNPPRAASVTP